MNINATLIGQVIFLLAIVMPVLGYYLGRRKTETPILVAVVAFITAFIPPIALLFVIVLLIKQDISKGNKVSEA